MLIACISDIHGNLPALEAAIRNAKGKGADRIICAGDMTGYGPFPDEVCQFLKKRRIPTIIGNYDQKVIEVVKGEDSTVGGMKPRKREILLWTFEHLTKASREYLSSLPKQLSMRLGGYNLLLVHGSPRSMDDAIYPSITRKGLETKLGEITPEILICGHTHIPFAKSLGGTLVVNCGSAGHPVDGDPRPAYAIVQVAPGVRPQGRIIRFDYDRERTIAVLERTSLPKGLRKDFAEGTKMRFLI